MTDTQLQRMAQAAAVIRRVVGHEFRWETPGQRNYGKHSVMVLLHPPGDPLRGYCDYDCYQYQKIEALTDALSEIGLYVEDCTGDYSGVFDSLWNPWGSKFGYLPATWTDPFGRVWPVVDGDRQELRFLDPQGVCVGLRLKGDEDKREDACEAEFAVPCGIDAVGDIHPADAPVGYYLGA